MSMDLELYTGKLVYNEVEFSFVFNREKLRLVPPIEKEHEVHMWFMRNLGGHTYTFGNPVYIKDDYLVGQCNETGQKIIFFPGGSNIGRYNSALVVNVDAYIIQEWEREYVDGLRFTSQEIDCIYPTRNAIQLPEWSEDGVISIKTKDFDSTTSQRQSFSVDGRNVSVFFDISRVSSGKISRPPLELHSAMVFEFEETRDYAFILKLWRISRHFIRYLCYRKNVKLVRADILASNGKGKHENFAKLYIVSDNIDNEPEMLERGRYIKQKYINGVEGKILNDIAEDKIYLRHLPETYRVGRTIDAARFVMITAAFEWTFRKNYPNGVEKGEKTIEAENEATAAITKLIEETKGRNKRLKGIYEFLKKLVKSNSLQSEIEQMGKDYCDIIGIFGKRLYSMNGETLVYHDMGLRISKQRNNFAHGNLDKDFIGLSLLDLIYLEYVIYAMQLKEYGVDKISIQEAINDLFGCNLAIKQIVDSKG